MAWPQLGASERALGLTRLSPLAERARRISWAKTTWAQLQNWISFYHVFFIIFFLVSGPFCVIFTAETYSTEGLATGALRVSSLWRFSGVKAQGTRLEEDSIVPRTSADVDRSNLRPQTSTAWLPAASLPAWAPAVAAALTASPRFLQ